MPFDGRKVRVLVVDDSALMRKLIPKLLEADEEIEVIATAIDGDFAINKVEQLKPDVVTLDIDMPRMDGLTALNHIVSGFEVPVVMLSSLTTRGAAMTMKALEMGAVDFICKPRSTAQVGEMAEELAAKIKAAARSKVVSLSNFSSNWNHAKKKIPATFNVTGNGKGIGRIVVIGASSGGPYALRYMLPRIPVDFAAGIIIVQHMPESFTPMFAKWLDDICEIEVKEAQDGELATPGKALIAPGSSHLKVTRKPVGIQVMLERGAAVNGHMPSVDVLFRSVAEEFGGDATAVIMTGMGSDGVDGIGKIKGSGGHTIAQDKESCAIFGMPRVAIDRGYIDKVMALSDMPAYLVSRVGRLQGAEVSRNA